MDNQNPLEIARKVGDSIALDLGAEAFTELQLSFVTPLLPRFCNNPVIRVKQHVLLYWDQSYLKSTLIDEFAKSVPDNMKVINISSLTPQMLFGSITENRKDIVRPVLHKIHFAKISELLGFLGSGNTMKDIVNTMNDGMENKTITRYLLKFGQPDFDKTKIEELEMEGLRYNPFRAQLSYEPNVCIWAASRPMDNRTYTNLRTSGHLYRYHVLQHEISDEEAEKFFSEEINPDVELQEQLKRLNERLAKIKIKDLRMPTKPLLQKIFVPLKEIVKDEIVTEKRRLSEILDIRTKGDIIRELAAHAFIRTVIENGFRDIDKLEYAREDVEFILQRLGHFVEFKINPLFVEGWTKRRVRKKRPRDQVKELILQFLAEDNVRQRKDIVSFVNNQIRVGDATIANALDDLLKEGKICQPKYGFYKLKDCENCNRRDTCTSSSSLVAGRTNSTYSNGGETNER